MAGSGLMEGESGGMPTSTWGGLTKKQWGYGAAAAGALIPALFGGTGGGDYDAILKNLEKSTAQATDTSKTLGVNAQDLFSQVIPYLKAVTSGDRQAILGATMPERKRVIDQYSAAKKAIAEFQPRSGGTAAAMSNLQAGQASDLSMIGANARTNAIGEAANLGTGLEGQSQSALNQAMQGQGAMANIISTRNQQSQAAAGQWGNALGLLAGLAFL